MTSIFDRVSALEATVAAQAAMIADLTVKHYAPTPTLAMLAERVSRRHKVTVAEIRGRGKVQALSRARKELCVMALGLDYTTTEIGDYLGRDHTTVLHLAGRLARRRNSEDPPC